MSCEPFKIEKQVPIPEKQDHSAKTKYPFAKMEIGDSFFIPNVSKTFSIYSMVRQFNSWSGTAIRVTQRRESDGIRVWRIH